jgi:anti-anti-sigma factor
MDFQTSDLGHAAKVVMQGRLDTPGVGEIETRFLASVVPAGRHAVVDLSGVSFVSSMGIRMLISAARSLSQKKAKLILYGAQPLVQESLDNVSLSDIVPIVASETQALELLKS